MNGRIWRNLDEKLDSKIRTLLLQNGGEEAECHADFERWRIRVEDSTFTSYTSGVIYSTPTESDKVKQLWEEIDEIVGFQYEPPTRAWVMGLDESGKGELFGSIFVAGVAFPKNLFMEIQKLANFQDTKGRHRSFEFWTQLYHSILAFRKRGLIVKAAKIPPQSIDSENLRKLLDLAYIRVIDDLLKDLDTNDIRVVIDDYMVEEKMKRKISELEGMGMEVVAEHGADERYLEVKVASAVAKYFREREIHEIREDERFKIGEITIGMGNANNEETLKWLEAWHKSGKPWPWFVRKSFRTIAIVEGRKPSKRKFK